METVSPTVRNRHLTRFGFQKAEKLDTLFLVYPDDSGKELATVLSYLAGRSLSREEIWTAMELPRSTYYDQLDKGTLILARRRVDPPRTVVQPEFCPGHGQPEQVRHRLALGVCQSRRSDRMVAVIPGAALLHRAVVSRRPMRARRTTDRGVD